MGLRRVVISIGVGASAFLVASVVGFEVFGADFPSVFYVLPIAIVAAIGGAYGAYRSLGPTSSRIVRSTLAGIAAFSFSWFLLWFVRYSIAATRAVLSFDLMLVSSIVVAGVVAVIGWIYPPVLDEN